MNTGLLLALLAAIAGHELNAGALPVCSNRVIGTVAKRAGCTLGDTRCWLRGGGFCMDHVEARLKLGRPAAEARFDPVQPGDVRAGDVAVFNARAHYAYVEAVVRDPGGRPVAVDLTEYNFGTCWVDPDLMVTDQYKILNRRPAVALREVDGGFLRARATPR